MAPKRKAEDSGDESKKPPTRKLEREEGTADSDSDPVTRETVAKMQEDLALKQKEISAAKRSLAEAKRTCNKNEPKEKRTRRKKDEDEPDYEEMADDILNKKRAKREAEDGGQGRTPQSCVRCNVRKMKCSPGPDPCENCEIGGFKCIMVDKVGLMRYTRGELQRLREDNERLRNERDFYIQSHVAAGGQPLLSHPSPATQEASIQAAAPQETSGDNSIESGGQSQEQDQGEFIDNSGAITGVSDLPIQGQRTVPEAQPGPSQFPQAPSFQGAPHYRHDQQYHGDHYEQPPQSQRIPRAPQHEQTQSQYFENPFDPSPQNQYSQPTQGYSSPAQIPQRTLGQVEALQQRLHGQQHQQYRPFPGYQQQPPEEDLPQHIDPSVLMRRPEYPTQTYPTEQGRSGHNNTQDQNLNDRDVQMAIMLSHETARSQDQDSNLVHREQLDREQRFGGT